MFQKHDYNFFSRREGQLRKSRKHFAVVGVVILVVASLGVGLYLWAQAQLVERETQLAEIQEWLDSPAVSASLNEARLHERRITLLEEYVESAEKLKKQIRDSSVGGSLVLDELAAIMPDGVQIDTLGLAATGLSMTCSCSNMDQVAALWYQLDASTVFADPVIGQTMTAEDGRISFPITAGVRLEAQDASQ